ncbi:MAG: hypothetical protein KF905_14420 [Flavobacteriales bacterium]|nr:hypothetical protein [Flavobacteriales bacterium]
MSDLERLAFAAVLVTLLLLLLFGVMAALLIVNANRRHRHRAQLAELHLQRDRELRKAEREATQHTLTEVGRELHDNVGQLLTVAQVGLYDHLNEGLREHPRVRTSLEALDEGLEEVRRLGRSLDQDRWQELSLRTALETEAHRLQRLGKARVQLRMNGNGSDPDRDVKTMLFRSFQEVVSNALRHSGARTISITLEAAPAEDIAVKGPTLRVSDDGRGFDTTLPARGNGLANIRKRCALVGYSAQLMSAPGQGTTWTFEPSAHEQA